MSAHDRYQFIFRVLIDYLEKRFARASRALRKGGGKLSKAEANKDEMEDIESTSPPRSDRCQRRRLCSQRTTVAQRALDVQRAHRIHALHRSKHYP